MAVNTETKQFQYEIQSYQEDCVNNITRLFESLRQKVNFVEVLKAHQQKNKYNFLVQDTKNIDIMMETRTGKTFTYIKTIFEFCRLFGYKKFIVLVPSVAISEGTKTNLEDTKNYFKSLYANEKEKEIETFVYEGGNISAVKQFIGTSHLSVLVMTPSSFSHNVLKEKKMIVRKAIVDGQKIYERSPEFLTILKEQNLPEEQVKAIEIFGKLPRLKIKTPMGDYNPDFCYAFKSTEGKKVFLVVEAKGYKSSTEISTTEKAKIDFATKYFEALNEYYKDHDIKITFKERINKTQLAA
ncbi:MAG: DEAD/DEAH box helicase family protein [Bacteroidales bacterium]